MNAKSDVSLILSKEIPLSQEEIYSLLETPLNENLGDIAFPCFSLSKILNKSPVKIATELQNKIIIQSNSIFSNTIATGPYLNFFINASKLAQQILPEIFTEKGNYGHQKKNNRSVVVEYCSPNTNKPLHLGHLRNLALGESISRLFESQGYTVHRICLNNNRGVHISKSMLAYQKWGNNKLPDKKTDHFVGDFYVLFSQKSKKLPELELDTEALDILKKWEDGDADILALWEKMNQWALQGFTQTYTRFGVEFDQFFNESDHYKGGRDIIHQGLEQNLFMKDESGAIVADLGENLGTKVLLRADGTSLYITQDLNLGVVKAKQFPNFSKSIYVVGNEQNYHFKVLFKLFKMLGFSYHDKVYHLNYGMVYLPEGRMKSREGTVVDADELIDNLTALARNEIQSRETVKAENIETLAEKIGLGALKYFLLKFSAKKGFTFNPKESISFDGDTGPYLQYSYVRAIKIIAKANTAINSTINYTKITKNEEFTLIKIFFQYHDILQTAMLKYSPSILAQYSFKLASAFSSFYENCKVLSAADPEIRQVRLLLVLAFSYIIQSCLALLGIEVVEEM